MQMPYRIAGIDVHKKMLAVVVSDVGAEGIVVQERRKFLSTPQQLGCLAEWLVEWEVDEVVMESTAQYWQPVWGALEETWQPSRQGHPGRGTHAGKIHLAQAQSNRGRRGRKDDFPDAERLIRRLVAGELILSFVPDPPQRLWRVVTRRRNQLGRSKVQLQNQLESLLEQAHIKLSSIVSDLLGVSERRMLQAIAEGERDPAVLAAMADRNLKATPEQLQDALSACRTLDPTFRELIRMTLEHLQLLEKQIEDLEKKASELMREDQDAVERLAKVPGMGVSSALQIIAEVGPHAASFPTPADLCSWVGVIPGQQVSAEKNQSSHSPKGNRPMRRILNEVAHAAVKTKGSIFEVKFARFVRIMKYEPAVWSVAHFMCELVWKILHGGVTYEERGPGVNAKAQQKRTQKMIRRLKKLGFRIEAPPIPPAPNPA
jgi:transposase